MTSLRVLIAPDSYKGSLSSVAVARAFAAGWLRARPADRTDLAPLADGGDGTLDAILAADERWKVRGVPTSDPLGRPIHARHLLRGREAIVELAEASGLSRLLPSERDALRASTSGTGRVLAAAIEAGAREVVLGVGGSATSDGGSGLIAALGARFLDAHGRDLPPGGGALARLARVELDALPAVLSEVRLTIASDVTNPLLGERGAAATYGPQKGASPAQVAELDAALRRYADVLETATGRSVRDLPGAGAAGGVPAGLLAVADRFASVELRPGVDLVMELTGFAERLALAGLVITGEGRVDAQTAFGKTALGVAARAAAASVPCVAIGGGVTPEGASALAAVDALSVSVSEGPGTLEMALAAGAAPLERAAERVARLIALGQALR